MHRDLHTTWNALGAVEGTRIIASLVRFKASNALIREGVEVEAFDLATILNAKDRVENASMTDNTVKSIHVEAFAIDERHGPDPVAMSCLLEQNKVTFSAVKRASDLPRCLARTCCNKSRHLCDASQTS